MYAIAGIVVLIVIVFAYWRFASRRQSLPCPVWLRWMVELDNPFTRTNRAAVIVEHLDLRPGMTVLDMGCGLGRLALPVARRDGARGKVVAADLQAGMLQRTREKALEARIDNIEFVQAGAATGALAESQFDRALLVTVLGEVLDREAALRELHAALKPGGILSITELVFDPHFQRQATVRDLANRTGFRVGAVFGNSIAYTMHLEKPAAEAGGPGEQERVQKPEVSG